MDQSPMAAFVPLDESIVDAPSPFERGRGEERGGADDTNFLRTAEELRALPVDLITPLPAYSLYQEQEAAHHHPGPLTKARPNPFESFAQHAPSQATFFRASDGSPPSSSTSPWLLFGRSTSEYHPVGSSAACTHPPGSSLAPGLSNCPPRGPQSSSFSMPLYSPGLHLNLSTGPLATAYDYHHHQYFPLTPPVDDPKPGEASSYPFGFDGAASSTLLPVFPSLLSSSSSSSVVANEPDSPFTVTHAFEPSHPDRGDPVPQDSSSSLPHLPFPVPPSLAALVSRGLSRRRSRVPPLPSPSLSSTSLPSSTRAKKCRTSHGGSKSQYARDEVTCMCVSCRVEIATLQLRKKGTQLDIDFELDFRCFDCAPELVEAAGTATEDSPTIGYSSSLSALLDREEGIETPGTRRRSGVRCSPRKTASGRKGETDRSLNCDVCRRAVAVGEVRPVDPYEKLNFTVEVICSHCSSTYRRCSDDGGGGGRLGVGKWRCKELFEEGRRNCSFSHARMGPIQDLIYDTHSISEIPQDLARLESTCFDFFRNSVLSALAVPDVLEGEHPVASSYEQIEKMAVDSWTHFEPFFKPESSPTKRTFIGLRWANPTTRKKGRKNPAVSGEEATDVTSRAGMKLTGFAIMEADIATGLLFTPITMPIGSVGETYDASTTLLQHLSRHVASDLELINLERRRKRMPSIPPIEEAWTAVLFSKDTRGTNHLETRRGYLPSEKYYSMHDATSAEAIHERMNQFLPECLQGGWRLFVRPYRGACDDWGQLVSGRRRKKSVSSAPEGNSRFHDHYDSDADYEETPAVRRTKRSRV